MKIRAALFVFAVCATVVAQPSGGGGENGGRDSNPWNARNWSIQKSSWGTDTVSSWDLVNGQAANLLTVLPWGQGIDTLGAYNRTGTPKSGFMTSEGTSKFVIRWIGTGPAPSKVLVAVTSQAWGGVTPSSDVNLANGLGTPIDTEVDFDPYALFKSQRPRALREVMLSQGIGELVLEKVAHASTTGGTELRAYASARLANCEIAERALTVSGDPRPSYVIGIHDAPVPQSQPDPTHLDIEIGIRYFETLEKGHGYAMLSGDLWGAWNMPRGNWVWSDYQESNPLRSHLDREYSWEEVVEMVEGGPKTLSNSCTVIDEDRVAGTVSASVRIHAPWEFPALTSSKEVQSEKVQVSAWVVRSPYGKITLSQSVSWAHSVTKKLSIGLSGTSEVLAARHPVVVGLNVGFEYGVTAGLTQENRYAWEIEKGPPTVKYCIVKGAVWKEASGFCLAYGPNGFSGFQDLLYVYWRSGSRRLAESGDHIYDVLEEPV